jgi:hypothetical protein
MAASRIEGGAAEVAVAVAAATNAGVVAMRGEVAVAGVAAALPTGPPWRPAVAGEAAVAATVAVAGGVAASMARAR